MTSAVLLSLCVLAIHVAALVTSAHPDEVYYFKVYTQEDPDYIRHRLHGIDVRHIFEIPGQDLYYILVSNDQRSALGRLDFPRSTKVTQLPVGPVCQFLVNFNVAGCQPMNAERVDFDAGNLTFVKFEIRDNGSFEDLAGLGEMLKAIGEVYTPAIQKVKSEVYYLVGVFPPRFYMVLNGGRDEVEEMVESLRTTGGGREKVKVVYTQMTEVPGPHTPPPHHWSQH